MQDFTIGDMAPQFTLPAAGAAGGGQEVSLSDYLGKIVVLYFYPKDNTSGCTRQACDFRDNLAQFNDLGVQVLGVSRDSVASHERFSQKQGLNFPLLSDEGGKLCEAYGVWVEKKLYGRRYMGIERSSFLIDEKGRVAAIWRGVKVAGHVDAVKEAIMSLKSQAA